jgi:putative ABC transport system substrate-binding protein
MSKDSGGEMKHRTAAGLLVLVCVVDPFGCSTESWGEAKIPRVGILSVPLITGTTDDAILQWYEPLRRGLARHGWVEGKNVSFEYRSALGNPPRYDEAAAELLRLKVDVIYAGSAPATRAAYAATRSIPIVGLDYTNDPVAAGYAESYARPGRNLTGLFLDAPGFAGKWLELLKSIVPGLSRVAVLWDPSPGATHLKAVEGAARALKVQLQVLEVHELRDIDKAFAALRPRSQALIILPSPMIAGQSDRLAELAMQRRLPATSMAIPFAEAGGMLSYGPDPASALERCGILVGKILDGAKPADLAVERPSKFVLVVNLKTAKVLQLKIPNSVLLRADKVIE